MTLHTFKLTYQLFKDMPRVVSKDLFNFKPSGQLDDDIIELEKTETEGADPAEMQSVMDRMAELQGLNDEVSNMEFASIMREACVPFGVGISESPKYKESVEQTTADLIKVATSHCGDFQLPVEVYTPKDLEGETKRAAYVYAHGGGCVAMTAADMAPFLRHAAVQFNAVVFNVDYRIAPEVKCPSNVKDFYEAIKYICSNADSLGIDPAKICIAGDSGGGYVCLGAMVMLAKNNETDLVKLAIVGVPMVDDYCFSDPLTMTVEERHVSGVMKKIWKDLIAADYEEQKSDPLLFPGKASDEELEKFPPTVIMECEFDHYITEATRLATRLRRVGRLLEFVVIPGAGHASSAFPDLKSNQSFFDALKTVVNEYLHS